MISHAYPALSCGNHDENHGQHIHVIDGRGHACFGYTAPEPVIPPTEGGTDE